MNKDDYKRYFQILEIDEGASLDEIERAYNHLKELYSTDTMVTFPIEDELEDKKKEEIIEQVENAYIKLKTFLTEKDKIKIDIDSEKELTVSVDEVSKIEVEELPTYDGKTLKEIRENLKIKLDEVSREIEVSHKTLKNIEHEKFNNLPNGGYLRWHISKYATYLSIDPKKASDDYMKRYREWEKEKKAKKEE